MKNVIKGFLILSLLAGLYVAGVLIYGTLTDFNPPSLIKIAPVSTARAMPDSIVTLLTWNIGYTGQGAKADFFYDGGKQVRAQLEEVEAYRKGIADFLASNADVDVFLIQEIDSLARRSYHLDQVNYFGDHLPGYTRAFATNYDVKFVPMPLLNPMGRVVSGLATYSRLPADGFERHSFDSQFRWPTRIFFLDRCFLSHRTPMPDGNDLVVINTHCSAYDTSGVMVADEIKKMVTFAHNEYLKGHYVVMGGDWNQCPPGYTPIDPSGGHNEHVLSDDQLPSGWRWVADVTTPTNRKLNAPYSPQSYTTVIDHFAVSPNLNVLAVKGIDQQFAWSDHQPVKLTVKLSPSVITP